MSYILFGMAAGLFVWCLGYWTGQQKVQRLLRRLASAEYRRLKQLEESEPPLDEVTIEVCARVAFDRGELVRNGRSRLELSPEEHGDVSASKWCAVYILGLKDGSTARPVWKREATEDKKEVN